MTGRLCYAAVALVLVSCDRSVPPDRAIEALSRFELTHQMSDLSRLYDAAAASSDLTVLTYRRVRQVVFPHSWEQKTEAANWLLQRRQGTQQVLSHLAALRGEPKDVMLYLECIALFLEKWVDLEWRRGVISVGARAQRECVASVVSGLSAGDIENATDYGSLVVSKELEVACALYDLAERYGLQKQLDRDTLDILESAERLTPPQRAHFAPHPFPAQDS